jgi:hypothetical protein
VYNVPPDAVFPTNLGEWTLEACVPVYPSIHCDSTTRSAILGTDKVHVPGALNRHIIMFPLQPTIRTPVQPQPRKKCWVSTGSMRWPVGMFLSRGVNDSR